MVQVTPKLYLEDIVHHMATKTMSARKRERLIVSSKDDQALASLTMQSIKGIGFTEKQRNLCYYLIRKYEDQLKSKLGLVLDKDYTKIPIRIPLRKAISSSPTEYEIRFSEDKKDLEIRFPFDDSLQRHLRGLQQTVAGYLKFNKDAKSWFVFASNRNIKYFVSHFYDKFKVSDELMGAYERIKAEDEKHHGAMVLQPDLSIPYAPTQLVEFLKRKTDQMSEEDRLLYLVDRAGLYGYEICESLQTQILMEYGPKIGSMILGSNVAIEGYGAGVVFKYANKVNRDIFLIRVLNSNYGQSWKNALTKQGIPFSEVEKGVRLGAAATDGKRAVVTSMSGPSYYRIYLDECAKGCADRVVCIVCNDGRSEIGFQIEYTKPAEKTFNVNENQFNY